MGEDPFGWLDPIPFDQPDPFTPLFDSLYAVYVSGEREPEPEPTRAVARSAPSVVDVLTQGGILRAAEVVELAAAASLDLAAAASMLEKESYGGRNVWGSDGVATAGAYIKGSEVTQAAYLAYRDAVHAGHAGRQGVGPTQLTWHGYQDQADQLGGCWDWRINCRVGFEALASGIRDRGLRGGFRGYNGSGPAAEAYADDAMTRYRIWCTRLAGAVSEEDEDLTPEESRMLAEVHAELTNREQAWGGGITDAEGNPYKPYEFTLRNNVEVHQATQMLEQQQGTLAAIQDTLAEFSTDDDGELGQLSQADVNRIAATVIALLGSKFSTP